jgi:hypothetical protein
MTKAISSEAKQAAMKMVRGLERSETRGTAEAMMPPRVPDTLNKGGDIVQAQENLGSLSQTGSGSSAC